MIASCLFVGFNISGTKITFKKSYKISIQSFIIFSLNYFVTVILKISGLLSYNVSNVNDVYHYQSLPRFLGLKNLPQWATYPLDKINISEIVYVFFLGVIIYYNLKLSKIESIKKALIIYGIAMIFWIIITVFFEMVYYT